MAALIYWLEARPTVSGVQALVCGISAALLGGLAESVPSKITDNLRVGLAAAAGVVLAHTALWVGA
jgi:hypothetical protein